MTGISTLGQALDRIEQMKDLQASLADYQLQITTGHKTNLFKGLGTQVVGSERARANFKMLDTYTSNIQTANTRMNIMTNAMSEFKSQSQNVLGAITVQPTQGEADLPTVGDMADKVSQFLGVLVNQQDGDRYLFGGANTLQKPVTDDGTMDTYMQGRLDAWVNGTIDTATLIQSYRSRTQLTDTTMGYSSQLATGTTKSVTVKADEGLEVDYTVLANGNAMRDITVAVNMLKNLSKVVDKVSSDPGDPAGTTTAPGASKQQQSDNFYQLYYDLTNMLKSGLTSLDVDSQKLAQAQVQVNQISDSHAKEKASLKSTIGDIENADINEAAVKIQALQIQLEASYRVTASAGSLSLTNFLPIT